MCRLNKTVHAYNKMQQYTVYKTGGMSSAVSVATYNRRTSIGQSQNPDIEKLMLLHSTVF